jgi:uncharacterized protein YyaL (SSP411 family)
VCLAVLALAACAEVPADPPPDPAPAAKADVVWDEWTAEAFVRAKAENRLVFVDAVVPWSHDCHVMDRTAYADAKVASLLDAEYVAIRVDADAHPDVAERWRGGGWPVAAVLAPDGRPLSELRGTHSADAIAEALRKAADDFRAGRLAAPRDAARPAAADADLAKVRDAVAARLEAPAGGATVGSELLAGSLTGRRAQIDRALALAERQAKLVDPVWGGVFGGDETRREFQKTAAAQADAISGAALAFAATGDKRYLDTAKAVQRYVADFLTAEDGAFWASQDSDAGTHGPADVWIPGVEYFPLDDAARRAKGVPPVDTNVYADCNGLLVESLCDLYEATRDPAALNAARKAANRIAKTHAASLGGFTHGDAAAAGRRPMLHLSDQVAMGRAFLALADATGDPSWIGRADAVAQALRDLFEDKAGGGFHAHSLDARAGGVFGERRKPLPENARAAQFLVRLHHLTGEELWRESAERVLRSLAGEATAAGADGGAVEYLVALEEFSRPPIRLDVVGRPGTKETNALYAAALSVRAPWRIVKLTAPGDEYPDIGKSAVYACSGKSCSSPVTDPAKVADAAQSVAQGGAR